MSFKLIVKTQSTTSLQASKWLKIPVLLDVNEMKALIDHLGPFWIFLISGVVAKDNETLSPVDFLQCYSEYIDSLKQGQFPLESAFRKAFSSVWTTYTDALYSFPINENQQLIKIQKPVIHLQPHRFEYSSTDGKFHSMVFGTNSVWWGIQFSYPQLFQDENLQILQVKENEFFPNTTFFKKLQKWIRDHTVPTPFFVDNKRMNVPIRLGKNCFSWINHHPQLAGKGLRVII